jgi:DNA-binding HxlR family transcriptional regulator
VDRQSTVVSRRSAVGQSTVKQTAFARGASAGPRRSSHEPSEASGGGSTVKQSTVDLNRLDRVIHERLRLGIVSALAVNDRLSFNDLKKLLRTTDGNLSVHARKLEDAQYVACDKSFAGRVPRTEYRLTAAGRRALEKYLAHMEALIKAVRD